MQVLTHVREKLQFVGRQNAALAAQLGELDAQLLEQREELAGAKTARLACLARAERLCGSSTAVLDPVLRLDLQACINRRNFRILRVTYSTRQHQAPSSACQASTEGLCSSSTAGWSLCCGLPARQSLLVWVSHVIYRRSENMAGVQEAATSSSVTWQ